MKLTCYFFGRSIILSFGLMFIANISIAQKVKLHYDLKEDIMWLKQKKVIVKRGFEFDNFSISNAKKQLSFFKTCIALGKYYETMYDKAKIKSMKQSIFYYEKVADFGRFPDEEKYFNALSLRNSVLRKLADIYFRAKGIKKDRNGSMGLALRGSTGYNSYFTYYSKRYFNCNCIIIGKEIINDSFYTLKYNPFALQSDLKKIKLNDKYLNTIANKFRSILKKDTSNHLYFISYPQTSMRSQYHLTQVLENIRYYMIKLDLPSKKILIDARIEQGDNKIIEWFISKSPPL